MLCTDCIFADYGPQATPIQMKGAAATAAFFRCTFASSSSPRENGMPSAAILSAQSGASVKLEECTFEVVPGRIAAQLNV